MQSLLSLLSTLFLAAAVAVALAPFFLAPPADAQTTGDNSVTGDLNTNVGNNSTVDSNNATNSNSETNNYNSGAPGALSNPVPSAVAPTVMGGGGNDSCLIPYQQAFQISIFGRAEGKMEQDPECNRRKDARILGTPQAAGGLGLQVSGISLMCQSTEVFRAMALANTPCPIADVVSGQILIGRDAYVRMRDDPDTYIVGYRQQQAFWDALLLIGKELPDAPPEPERPGLSERFRRHGGADDGQSVRSRQSD